MEKQEPARTGRAVPWLYCSDVSRSIGFYCNVLGFTLLSQTAAEQSAYIDSRGARIMLQQIGEGAILAGTPEYPFGRGVHLLLEADDVDLLHGRLEALGGREDVLVEPRNRYYRAGADIVGHREIVVRDPDGYLLRFYHTIEGLEEA